MMTLASLLVRVALFVAVGAALGTAHFAALHLNTKLYLAPGPARTPALGLHAIRMAVLVAACVLVARFGGLALAAAFAGLLVGRRMVTSRIVRAS